MKPIRGAGPPPRILACADGKAEATFVVGTILQMEKEDKLQASSSVAVIYRTNAQSRLIEEACVQKKVKYIVRGATGRFYSRAEIKDCLCFLRFLYNGRDESAFIRAIKTPSRGIGQVALNQFFAYHSAVTSAVESNDLESGNFSLLEVLISLSSEKNNEFPTNVDPNNYIAKRAMNNFVSFSSKMRHISEVSTAANVTSLLTEVIDHLELKQHFQAISKTQDEMDDRMSNVNELLLASEKYEGIACSQAPDSALGNFLDDISLLSDAVEEDTSQGNSNNVDECITVNLMTVHASKGMEFDAVFLIGNEEGIFPTQRAKDSGNDSVELEEERRLCYVAMTRARTHLLLTWRKEISFFGQSGQIHYRTAYRSRFLDALVAKQKRSEVKDNDSKATRQSRRPQINSNMNGTRGRRQKSFSTQTRRTSEISKASAVNRIPTRERRKPLTRYGGSRVQSSQGSGQYQQYFGKDTKSYRTTKKETIDFDKFNVDSTLFYPVGKTVSHRVHGVGTVVPPLPNKKDFVRVKFADSGFTLDFPMSGSGLE
uniref:UvrD-like helicase C-terminal domain-containing protein n=1 Tax=Leptocylindrus danicus TaxID=163516 RepID=A0A7S2K5P5_9STRA